MKGGEVAFHGKAANARTGSVVRLQRRASGGWVNVASTKVWVARSFSFTVTPPKGYQDYRVIKPRQLGQGYAASPSVRLTVQWQPTLTLAPVMPVHVQNWNQMLDVGGTSNVFGAEVRLQRQTPYGWAAWGSTTVTSLGTFSGRLENLPRGTVVRARVPGVGARLPAFSVLQATELLPFELTLGGPSLHVGGIRSVSSTAPSAIAHLAAHGGDLVTFQWSSDFYGSLAYERPHVLVGPDGQEVTPRSSGPLSSGISYFPIRSDGVYSLLISSEFEEPVSLYVSATRQSENPTTLDSAEQPVHGVGREQVATLDFTASKGQVVNVAWHSEQYVGFCGRTELAHEGEPVAPVGDWPFDRTFEIDADGQYSFAFVPCAAERVSIPAARVASMQRNTLSVNESAGGAVLDEPGEGAIVSFDATTGDEITLTGTSLPEGYSRAISYHGCDRMIAPDGSQVTNFGTDGVFIAAQTGTYEAWCRSIEYGQPPPGQVHLWASTPLGIDAVLNGAPVSVSPIPGRRLDFHFSGTQDQYVTLFEDYPDDPAYATIVRLFDDQGNSVEPIGPMDVFRLPHDRTYEARVYTGATSGHIGLVSSAATNIAVGTTTSLSLAHGAGVIVALIPPTNMPIDVTASNIQLGGASYQAELWTPNGRADLQQSTASTDPFTLSSSYTDQGLTLILRSDDDYATGTITLSVSETGSP
jgi:hypothetical protein